MTDPTRLKQILINLVGNAIKFTSAGQVQIAVRSRICDEDAEKTLLEFEVRDTGPGIPLAKRHRLFQPFMQADTSTRRNFGGTGLGLALSKAYAEALGGSIELLESGPNEGATFLIKIVAGLALKSPYRSAPALAAPPRVDKPLHNIKVLVVDDSPDNRELITMVLEASGARVECAENGSEAIRQAIKGVFDVILMDIQMPGIDGFEAAHALRSGHYKKPILAVTAHAMKGERERCLNAGFDEHLSKPINPKLLIDTVARFSYH